VTIASFLVKEGKERGQDRFWLLHSFRLKEEGFKSLCYSREKRGKKGRQGGGLPRILWLFSMEHGEKKSTVAAL